MVTVTGQYVLAVKYGEAIEQELRRMERENLMLPRMQWENVKPAPGGPGPDAEVR